jgi:excisionase family DNA binding protein
MNDSPPKNPFDALLDAFRLVVREEMQKALTEKQPPRLQFTLQEAAQRLSVKPSLLGTKVRAGILPHHRIGRRIFFTQQDIEAIDQLTKNGTEKS